MKVLRSSVGHKNDSSPLSRSATYLFPFEALFNHLIKREKKPLEVCFCFVFQEVEEDYIILRRQGLAGSASTGEHSGMILWNRQCRAH